MMKYIRPVIYIFVLAITFSSTGQETSLNNYTGDWGNNSSWVGGWTDGTPAFLSLPESAGDITIQGNIQVGDATTSQNLTFAANNNTRDFTVNDTLIVYGDVDFANKSMNLVLGNSAVLIILGDLDMNNKIDIASGGTLVVSGNFNKNGSQGSYTGDGNVYAGSFSGDAESTIDDGTGDDSSFVIDQLSDDGFSDIEDFVTGGGTNPLPVELLFFNVELKESVVLTWATSTEINNDYFTIERSEDGNHFYEIARVKGHGDTNEEIHYSFEDKFVFAEIEYYRLKQVDFDGQFEYFEIKMITTNVSKESATITAYPTIVRNSRINVTSTKPFQIIDASIVSLEGSESKSLTQNTIQENPLNYDIDLTNLRGGIYILNILTSEGDRFRSRIVIK